MPAVTTAILGTGAGAVLQVAFTGRASARKITSEVESTTAKLPSEIDSVVVHGAEGAVLVMQGVNDRLIAELHRKDEYIVRLEDMVAALREQLTEANRLVETVQSKLREAEAQYREMQVTIQKHRESP